MCVILKSFFNLSTLNRIKKDLVTLIRRKFYSNSSHQEMWVLENYKSPKNGMV